ncbi:M1-specific T cell receptor alpha chain-like [Acanthopagrus latus]|uniref:M1-specific T cell receptor alpha chain-like n=1 Tax=Acanthopagrus latus TaxID=8177 RepID=UPI00187BF6CC|nr:M1-specific T cell receptor alpha chain-like [Acanthopagrus latus]
MIFGSGTRLNVEPKLEVEPDYYRLEDNGTTACLATGFTRQDGTYNHELFKDLINKTAAVRIEDDKVYNQVVVLPTGNNGDRCETGTESKDSSCEDGIKPDPKVNFVSVTVLCLRLLFIKTVVFNVLMTFRLWISQ